MALIVYPTASYDTFVDLATATTYIGSYTIKASDWNLLADDATREVYLRIATQRVIDTIDISLLPTDSVPECIEKSVALMAIHDVVHGLSENVNPNKGAVTKEKVGDLEIEYYHGWSSKKKGITTSPFPDSVISCLTEYGAEFSPSGLIKATVEIK